MSEYWIVELRRIVTIGRKAPSGRWNFFGDAKDYEDPDLRSEDFRAIRKLDIAALIEVPEEMAEALAAARPIILDLARKISPSVIVCPDRATFERSAKWVDKFAKGSI